MGKMRENVNVVVGDKVKALVGRGNEVKEGTVAGFGRYGSVVFETIHRDAPTTFEIDQVMVLEKL